MTQPLTSYGTNLEGTAPALLKALDVSDARAVRNLPL